MTLRPGSEFEAPGQHEPLVSPELFDRVQHRLADARVRPTFTRLDTPLPLGARLLICARCGSAMVPKRRRGGPASGDGGTHGQCDALSTEPVLSSSDQGDGTVLAQKEHGIDRRLFSFWVPACMGSCGGSAFWTI
jgi:hypothetical protein